MEVSGINKFSFFDTENWIQFIRFRCMQNLSRPREVGDLVQPCLGAREQGRAGLCKRLVSHMKY